MNQPQSSCLTYYEEVSRANAAAAASESPAAFHVHNLTASPHQEPTDLSNDLSQLDHDAMDVEITTDSLDSDTNNAASESDSVFIEKHPGAAQTFGRGVTFMDIFDADPHASKRKHHPYYPFASRAEWELASFLLRSDLSMNLIDKFLKLELVSTIVIASFDVINSYLF